MHRFYLSAVCLLFWAHQSHAQAGLSAVEAVEAVEAAVARTPAGTTFSTDVPGKKTTNWDDAALQKWLADFQNNLGVHHAEIDFYSPSTLKFRAIYGKLSYYFESTYVAVGLANGAEEDQKHNSAWYVLAGNCQKNDPWACFNLSMLSMDRSKNLNIPAERQFELFRRAADADYTMATHWLMRHEGAVPALWSVKDQEAYLRRAHDINADFARVQLAGQLGKFYAVDHPDLDNDGYLKEALAVLRDYGEDEYADWLESQ